ncbi:unnamed protein product, partial [Urochloa humidicola]
KYQKSHQAPLWPVAAAGRDLVGAAGPPPSRPPCPELRRPESSIKIKERVSSALEGLSCSFENLKSLSLHTDFCFLSTILSTLCLLKNAPNLEELSIQIWYENVQYEEVAVDLLNS